MRYLLVFFIFLSKGLTAQYKSAVPYHDTLAVRFSPLGLVDVFDGNFTAGAAYTLNDHWTLSADLSYIFYSAYIERRRGVSGYIFKPGIRYYLLKRRNFFVESIPFYKRVGYKINDWLEKDCVNGVPAYRELKTFRFSKQVVGLNIQAGVQESLTRNNLLRLEIYAGISIRYKWQDIKNEPGACYQPTVLLDDAFFSAPNIFSAGVPHGLRLVYVIR
jgi:hypothetical protein